MRPRPLLALALATGLASCSIGIGWRQPSVWVEQTEEFDVPAGDLERLAVETHNGPITVRAHDDSRVHVRAVLRAGGADDADARAALSHLRVARSTEAGGLLLRGEWTREPESGWGSVVTFELHAPARLAARLLTHNGRIEVESIDGELDLTTHNGGISIAGGAGRLRATTHNGAIRYEGGSDDLAIETHNGRIETVLTAQRLRGAITTHNGAVTVQLPNARHGTIECETDNGGIAIEPPAGGVLQSAGKQRALLAFAEPDAARLRIETHNGSISVR